MSLPSGWVQTTLGEVIDLWDHLREPVNASERASRQGLFPYYGANGQAGTIDAYKYDGNFVLLAEDGGYFDDPSRGVAYCASGKFWVNNHAHVLKTLGEMSPVFLMRLLNSINWLPYVGGSTRLKLTQASMNKVAISLPPLDEQRRIVAKLEDLLARSRRAKEALDAVPALLERFRQSVLASAFRGDLTRDWREKNPNVEPASKLLERIRIERRRRWEEAELEKMKAKGKAPKDDKWKRRGTLGAIVDRADLPQLPASWCWVPAEDLAAAQPHSTAIGPFGSDLKVADYRTSGVPLIFVRDIRARVFSRADSKFVSPTKAEDLSAHAVVAGDVLMTKMGDPPGDTAVYPDGALPGIITADCIKLTPDREIAFPRWVANAMSSELCAAQVREATRGVAQQKISLGVFRRLLVPVPPIAEQQEIIRLVESIDASVLAAQPLVLREQLDRLEASLLSKAFRGELVPQDPADEPASVLLERIRAERKATDTASAPAATKRPRKSKA